MRFLHWVRLRSLLLGVCAIVALALEVFGFNHYAWSTIGSRPIENPAITVSDGNSNYGDAHDGIHDGITIDIYPGGDASTYVAVDSLQLDISLGRAMQTAYQYGMADKSEGACALHEVMTVYDEGHSQGYSPDLAQASVTVPSGTSAAVDYGTGHEIDQPFSAVTKEAGRIVCPAVPDSMRRFPHASGKVNRITLAISGDFEDATLNSITLNQRVPLRFDVARFALWFLLLSAVACFFTRKTFAPDASATHAGGGAGAAAGEVGKAAGKTAPWTPTQAQQCAWLLAMTAIMAIAAFLQSHVAATGPSYGYADLARSFLSGRLDIDDGSGATLSKLANPYDKTLRSAQGTTYPFDTAYYGGKIYLYFGAVPALLLYLPFRALTGTDLPDVGASMIVVLALVIAGFLLARELRRRLCPRMPWGLYLLLCAVMATVPFLCLMVNFVNIYSISQGAAIALAEFGLCLWLASTRDPAPGGDSGIRLPLGMAGSLCLALAVGCRPTMALASLFAFAIFGNQLRRLREPGMWWRVALLVAPYVPVAAGIMWYNAARFGSPFQFGAVYQLTNQDMNNLGADPTRIVLGLWYYLLAMPTFMPEFPFLRYTVTYTQYDGDLAADLNCGGAFILVPLLLLFFVPSVWKRCRKTASLRVAALAIAVIAIGADSMMGGLCARYGGDSRYALLLAAVASAMEWFADAWQTDAAAVRKDDAAAGAGGGDDAVGGNAAAAAAPRPTSPAARRRYRVLGAMCMIALLVAAFMAMGPYDDFSFMFDDSNTTFFFRLWDFFDLLKL